MAKYKVGDIVHTNGTSNNPNYWQNKDATIERLIGTDSWFDYYVRIPGIDYRVVLADSEVDHLVKASPAFKVGDRVITDKADKIYGGNAYHPGWANQPGTIVSMTGAGYAADYMVDFDNGVEGVPVYEKELSPYVEPVVVTAEPEFGWVKLSYDEAWDANRDPAEVRRYTRGDASVTGTLERVADKFPSKYRVRDAEGFFTRIQSPGLWTVSVWKEID